VFFVVVAGCSLVAAMELCERKKREGQEEKLEKHE